MGVTTKLLSSVALDHEPRRTLVERLAEHPEREPRVWVIFAVTALVSVVGHPGSLLITLPVGVYLFWCRQRAARERAQAQHDELAARADRAPFVLDPPTAPLPTVPDPVRTYDLRAGGRHAR